MATPVRAPWPISRCGITAMTPLSGVILIHVVKRSCPSARFGTMRKRFGARAIAPTPSTSPPPSRLPVAMNVRRVHLPTRHLRLSRERMNRRPNAFVGTAAANVRHGRINFCIAGSRVAFEQGCNRHDHARLTIAALRHLVLDPRGLDRVQLKSRSQSFDGRHRAAGDAGYRYEAGPHGDAVDMHRAGAARADAATELRTGEASLLADRPQPRSVGRYLESRRCAVQREFDHGATSRRACRQCNTQAL